MVRGVEIGELLEGGVKVLVQTYGMHLPEYVTLPLHHRNPMVTGTSVLGVKFDGGVILAADMLGSYGSMARFRNIPRLMKVNDNMVLGASGDYADYQYLKQAIEQMM
ncbi:hypothetical protein chiPu_0022759 [Chiloscyllium punctatum]|uniref:Proteasome subunit beta type-4 n=1 Tax=Chiloscyllium punctatum TaxID=137246 RepID=A0A401T9Q6_CHIPU|nr:hypothetical protein [Chiloscyllium punctatum]